METHEMEFTEHYYFLRMYSVDLNTARLAVKVLKRYRRADVRYALLRDLIVTYVRPFSVNKGRQSKHILSVKRHVPASMRSLHDELVRVRMQQFAHTDLTYYSPLTLTFRGPNGEFNGYGTMFKGYDYGALLEKLPHIEKLIAAVETSVNAELRREERESGTDGPVIPIPPEQKADLENLTEKSE
ncbi:hypothetical protein [Pseudomonas sp. BGI-2]|uniref:hypothetical protein n=1 Tax=Pseudomonas sp. BGI-2 TaxID=2528211 RepID=UPI001033CF68|nr:hypothetical protein [Pseudomonas sp. BGI-2]TBN49839.1 hypothetical protein EYC95_04220 [Pseudomonas sp. BGI-2]